MIVQWPTSRVFYPNNCAPILIDNARVNVSEETGTIQTVERPGQRWRFNVGWAAKKNVDLASVHAKLAEGFGRVGTFEIFAFHRPVPLIPMTGVRTTVNAVPQGASEIQVAMPSGMNFSVGDWISINGQLLVVYASPKTGDVATVRFSPRAKAAVPTGTTVFYNYARAEFRLLAPAEIKFEPKASRGFTATFEEVL